MAAVRLPPVRERKRPNGDGFSPRPMIRKKKGAPPKGGRRGENPGGGNRSPTPPRRANHNPHRAAGAATTARPQPRRRRDNALSRWRGSWARLHPRERSERIARPTYAKRPPREVFYRCVEHRPQNHCIMDCPRKATSASAANFLLCRECMRQLYL